MKVVISWCDCFGTGATPTDITPCKWDLIHNQFLELSFADFYFTVSYQNNNYHSRNNYSELLNLANSSQMH